MKVKIGAKSPQNRHGVFCCYGGILVQGMFQKSVVTGAYSNLFDWAPWDFLLFFEVCCFCLYTFVHNFVWQPKGILLLCRGKFTPGPCLFPSLLIEDNVWFLQIENSDSSEFVDHFNFFIFFFSFYQERFSTMIRNAGFSAVTYENLSFGIAAIHSGFKMDSLWMGSG